MRANIVNPIVQAVFDVLEEVLGTDISRRRLSKHDKTLSLHRISVLVGISGAVEGYVLFSTPLDVALSIVAVIANEETSAMDDVAQAAIIGLTDTIMDEAVRELRDQDVEVSAAPAALFWGQGMQLSCTEIEAAVIPLKMPMGTLELTVALREPPAPD